MRKEGGRRVWRREVKEMGGKKRTVSIGEKERKDAMSNRREEAVGKTVI